MSRHSTLFVVASAIGGGMASLEYGLSSVWTRGGDILALSAFGYVVFIASGLAVGAIAAIGAHLLVRLCRNEAPSPEAEGYGESGKALLFDALSVLLGLMFGTATVVSFCFCLSIFFFAAPFPRALEMITTSSTS